jgi:methionyl-tRNA synthetase
MPAPKFYLTTPIYYVNDEPHIGHCYTTVVADVVARYRRMRGFEVYFLTGTDEHGQKIERAARAQKMTPIALADRVVKKYHELWKSLRISHDDFIRTTEVRHRKGVFELFKRIRERNPDDIYLSDYEGWYCTPCEAFWLESQLAGGNCPDCGRAVELSREKTWFFRLSAWQERLLAFYEKHPGFIRPEHRRNEVVSFVKGGLRDLSISRSTVKWGIAVPGGEGHTFYVWFDALTNYASAVGLGQDAEKFARWWPAALHLIGKDILRFHAVYWPAFLMAGGIDPPRCVFGHGWWLRDEGKMSKSKGNVVRPDYLLRDFGADALRYFMLREMTFGHDAGYSDEAFLHRLNSDVANDLGNLLSRTVKLMEDLPDGLDFRPGDGAAAERVVSDWKRAFDDYAFQDGLKALWEMLGEANRAFDAAKPWELAKGAARQEALHEALSQAAESLRLAAVMLSPVCPGYAEEILRQLGLLAPQAAIESLRLSDKDLTFGAWTDKMKLLKARKGGPLFQRTDPKTYLEKEMTEQNKQPEAAPAPPAQAAAPPPVSPAPATDGLIEIDDFRKVRIVVAQVLEAEAIPKSKRLLRLIVDIGSEKRQVVAGVAERYKPEDLIGKRILFLANLKPAKLMGVESQGMFLAVETPEGGASAVWAPDDVPLGSKLR